MTRNKLIFVVMVVLALVVTQYARQCRREEELIKLSQMPPTTERVDRIHKLEDELGLKIPQAPR